MAGTSILSFDPSTAGLSPEQFEALPESAQAALRGSVARTVDVVEYTTQKGKAGLYLTAKGVGGGRSDGAIFVRLGDPDANRAEVAKVIAEKAADLAKRASEMAAIAESL
jgi:hypothetical protein